MQRSIASFFQPKSKEKDARVKGDGPVKEPVKSPLKAQNGVQEVASPVKKVVKRSRQILDSDEDDTPPDDSFKAVPTPLSPSPAPPTPATPVTPATPASSATPGTPTNISPSGIPKRKTARKMFPKRKLDESGSPLGGQETVEAPFAGALEEQPEQSSEGPMTQQSKRPRVESASPGDGDGKGDELMEVEAAKEEKTEQALTETDVPVEDKKKEKGEVAAEKRKAEEVEELEEVKKNNKQRQEDEEEEEEDEEKAGGEEKANGAKDEKRTEDEKGPADTKQQKRKKTTTKQTEEEEERVAEKDSSKSPRSQAAKARKETKEQGGDKDLAKKAAISSFFAPRKAAVKIEKVEEKSEGGKDAGGEKKKNGEKAAVEDTKDKKGDKTSGQTDFDPSRPNYHPIDHACWGRGQKVPYLAVARTFEKIEEDSGRLRNIETLSNLLRSVLLLSPDDLLCCVYLCLNQLGPAYLGMELGVGDTVLMKAVAQATGRQLDKIKAEAQEKGDLGLVAESSRSNQRMMFQPASLTAGGVFAKLKEISSMSGNSAMNKKIDIIKGLFVACRFSEARYIVRSLAGKLRIGLAEQSVLAALNQAVCLTPPGQALLGDIHCIYEYVFLPSTASDFPPSVMDASKGMSTESRRSWLEEKSLILKQTYCEMPNYDVILPVLLKEGIDQLPNHCKLTPGVPLRPMLAHPTKGVAEVMKRFDEAAFTCEYKYDGERAQIHILENGEVRVFSRNQEDNTSKYPDIIARIPKVKQGSVVSCVLDAEAVAWDREKKQIQPFQVLTTRKRKDVDASEIKVQVCVYAFDLLYLNGESLVRQPLSRRRALLKESFSEVEGEFVFARYIDSDNTEAIAEFLEQSVRDSCEGLMVKTLEKDATYEIAKRSHNWLKLKKDYLDGVGDTVDLCVIGAYIGKGKRTGTYGGFLLACYDDDNEEFQSVCKIGTGFKDEDLEQHYKFLKEHILPKPRAYYRVDQTTEPDVWLDAIQVWEVKCADLSLSPVYKAGMGLVDPEKGVSLRFPRFLRIRDDKKPEDATNGSQIADLYRKQQQIQNQGDRADMEDYY
ncbi:DNA ligase 1 [Merluccius polli]|uniref:DNA ligase n=1 Tax=Merluccius polli TaxID=89951 RepID=A0AA47P0D0_MERPO|nr:DNA ligase 1 [Merluccius polli]